MDTVNFFHAFFRENDAPEWSKYLDDYLAETERILVR